MSYHASVGTPNRQPKYTSMPYPSHRHHPYIIASPSSPNCLTRHDHHLHTNNNNNQYQENHNNLHHPNHFQPQPLQQQQQQYHHRPNHFQQPNQLHQQQQQQHYQLYPNNNHLHNNNNNNFTINNSIHSPYSSHSFSSVSINAIGALDENAIRRIGSNLRNNSIMMHRSAARSMPSANGYMSGSVSMPSDFASTNGGVAVPVGAGTNAPAASAAAAATAAAAAGIALNGYHAHHNHNHHQRHNSGSSNDVASGSGSTGLIPPGGPSGSTGNNRAFSTIQAQLSASMLHQVQQQQPPPPPSSSSSSQQAPLSTSMAAIAPPTSATGVPLPIGESSSNRENTRSPQVVLNVIDKNAEQFSVEAYRLDSSDAQNTIELTIKKEIYFDRGAFGTVFRARLCKEDNRVVAVKTVIQDKRYRNRELPVMKKLSHTNIVTLFYYYYTSGGRDHRPESLNLVMEFLPRNVSHLIPRKPKRDASANSIANTPLSVKIVMYQIFRALSYIHTNGICHRDIKPNNLLFNPETGVLKVCDFGSAKQLNPGERNVSYICARYYRAPELLFGATNYTNMIDLWSAGIVFSELLLGYPIFHSQNSGIDQLVNIIGKLGTPTREQIEAMNKDYIKYDLPQVPPYPLKNVFPATTADEALDLIGCLFQYDPKLRIRPLNACAHPYFNELRDPNKKWLNGAELPPLFNFTEFELKSADVGLKAKLLHGGSKAAHGLDPHSE